MAEDVCLSKVWLYYKVGPAIDVQKSNLDNTQTYIYQSTTPELILPYTAECCNYNPNLEVEQGQTHWPQSMTYMPIDIVF